MHKKIAFSNQTTYSSVGVGARATICDIASLNVGPRELMAPINEHCGTRVD